MMRSLLNGTTRVSPLARQKAELSRAGSALRKMSTDFEGPERIRPDARDIRQVVAQLTQVAPVLILIDEFGKNLEALLTTQRIRISSCCRSSPSGLMARMGCLWQW